MFVVIALLPVLIAAHGPASHHDDCRYTAERNATLDAADVRLFRIEAGAGSLKIQGRAGLHQVVIRGHACASSPKDLELANLETRREGTTLSVRANVHNQEDERYSWGEHQRILDVVVEVPQNMAAEISDGSGDMELHDLGDVDIDDGSGDIIADNIGAAHIQDGSGDISLHNVRGTVTIRDGSGDIDARKIAGDFTVARKGSGDIDYEDVSGRVDVPSRRRHHD